MYMSKPKVLALVMVVVGLLAIASGTASTADSSSSAELPPGPELNKARTACLTCHDAHIIVQQRLSKAAWGKEVDKMVKWGAIVDPADRDPLVDYFATNFAPDKPAYTAQRSAKKR
jgi:hypothetical protein